MKTANAAHLTDEYFVIRVDGRVKSHHRRFLDALREGLQLRDQFPQDDVKVQSGSAADCQQMAYVTRNEHERLTWLDMAQSWLQLAQASSAPLESQLDKSRRNAA